MDEIKSPVKAIRAFCLDCCGGNANDVRDCVSKICPLKPFRFGRNPYLRREMSDEQKEANAKRLAEARERKKDRANNEA